MMAKVMMVQTCALTCALTQTIPTTGLRISTKQQLETEIKLLQLTIVIPMVLVCIEEPCILLVEQLKHMSTAP